MSKPLLRLLGANACALFLVLVAGCCSSPTPAAQTVGPPVVPPPVDLRTPKSAVRSYLAWTSLAYRLANSDAASQTTTPLYGVHIDSYIELNREQGNKGIDQRLTDFAILRQSKEGTRVVLAASENWTYRYFSLADLHFLSPLYRASYDTTYTLVHDPKGWLVDDVQAKALTPVK